MSSYWDSHAVPGSEVSMDVFVSCQVLHPTGYLGAHHHQSLTNLLHLEQRITSRSTSVLRKHYRLYISKGYLVLF